MLAFKKKNINFIIYFALLAFFGVIIIISLIKKFKSVEGYTNSATQYAQAASNGAVNTGSTSNSNVKQLNLAISPGQF